MTLTLGQRLQHARKKKGLSLADVAHQTRIPVSRLKDMEDDNFNALGGMAYARGFVHTYAQLLEVNAESVLEQMQPPPLGGTRDYQYLTESYGAWINQQSNTSAHPATAINKHRSSAAVMAIASLVLLIGVGVLLGQAWLGERKNSHLNSSRTPSSVLSAPGDEKAIETKKSDIILPAKPGSTADSIRPALPPQSSQPKTSAPFFPKSSGTPPKALPVEDDTSKAKR